MDGRSTKPSLLGASSCPLQPERSNAFYRLERTVKLVLYAIQDSASYAHQLYPLRIARRPTRHGFYSKISPSNYKCILDRMTLAITQQQELHVSQIKWDPAHEPQGVPMNLICLGGAAPTQLQYELVTPNKIRPSNSVQCNSVCFAFCPF